MGKVPKQARITEAKTMKELNIFGPDTWLDKFPHWRCLCATIAEEEKRAALEAVSRAVARRSKGAGDGRGHQVGRELDSLEAQAEAFAQGLDEERLAQAGNPRQQTVTTGQQGDQQLLDNLVLANDALAYFNQQAVACFV